MSRPFASEVALGRALAPTLRKRGMILFPEVPLPAVCDSAGEALVPDLIAVSPRERIVECYELKLHVGVDLVADAARWVGYFNRSWAIAPAPSRDRRETSAFLEACAALKRRGAGLAIVDARGTVSRIVPPKFIPTASLKDIGIAEALEHAPRGGYAEAGSPGRARRSTKTAVRNDELAAALLALIESRPRIKATLALAEIGATPAFTAALKRGSIAGLGIERNRIVLTGRDEVAA